MSLSQFLFGNKDKHTQLPTMTRGQRHGLSSILGQLKGMRAPGGAYSGAQNYLMQLLSGSPDSYENFAAPYRTEFEEQTLPMVAERFAGLGGGLGGGTMGSSGFAQALGGASRGFQSNLASLYAQLQQAAAQQAMGQYNQLAGLGLGARPFENTYQQGSGGFLGSLGGGLGQGLGTAGGSAMMAKLLPLLGLA